MGFKYGYRGEGNNHLYSIDINLLLTDITQVLLSCAPVWEHPDVKKHNDVNLDEQADLIPWRDHWMQAIYYLPLEIELSVNSEICLIGYHDEYSFWFDIQKGSRYIFIFYFFFFIYSYFNS